MLPRGDSRELDGTAHGASASCRCVGVTTGTILTCAIVLVLLATFSSNTTHKRYTTGLGASLEYGRNNAAVPSARPAIGRLNITEPAGNVTVIVTLRHPELCPDQGMESVGIECHRLTSRANVNCSGSSVMVNGSSKRLKMICPASCKADVRDACGKCDGNGSTCAHQSPERPTSILLTRSPASHNTGSPPMTPTALLRSKAPIL